MGSRLLAVLLAVSPLIAADSALRFSKTFGGSLADSVTALTTDPNGYVITGGATSSYDFPVTDGSINRSTHFVESTDSGLTWHPQSNLPATTPSGLAVDTSTPPVWYAGSPKGAFKSLDGGATWNPIGPDCSQQPTLCGIGGLIVNPKQQSILYGIAGGKIVKTFDAGSHWSAITQPADNPNPPAFLVLDPFQPDHLFAEVAGTHYRSADGGITWSQFSPPVLHPGNFCSSGVPLMAFDPATPNVAYLQDHCDLFRSDDAGTTWTALNTPFQISYGAVPNPGTAGTAYVLTFNGTYVTHDYGATFRPILANSSGDPPYPVSVDPAHPSTVIIGPYQSTDGGQTFTRLAIGRSYGALVFDPARPGRAIAATSGAAAGFLAKMDSAGTILAATYLSGQGTTSITGVAADPMGNLYVTGTTAAADLPVTVGALLSAPPAGATVVSFAASFDPQLNLRYLTYLPGANAQTTGIAVDASGSAAVTGTTFATNHSLCFVAKLAPDFSGTIFSTDISADQCTAVASDAAGNTAIAGFTYSGGLTLAGPGMQTSLHGVSDAIVVRFDPAGNLVYSGYLGGGDQEVASGIALDAAGNMYVTGNTASKDFPTTNGAYQTALSSNCPYPSSAIPTGLIGTIFSYQTNDAFVTKFDPAGNLLYSTYVGGPCYDAAKSIAVDAGGRAWIAGTTDSSPFPQAMPFESGPSYAFYKAFVSELDSGGASLLLSSYIDAGSAPAIAIDPFGDAYVGGATTLPQPVYYPPPAPPSDQSGVDAALAKIQPQFPAPITIRAVGNAFTLRSGPVSPGQITLIAADGLAPATPVDLTFTPSAPLPRALAGTQVLFDGEPAALVSVAAGNAVAVAPYDLAGKSQTSVQVVFQGVASAPVLADIQADLGYRSLDGSGTGQAYALNPDGTLNSAQNPAPQGSSVTLFLTGIPAVDPGCREGSVANSADTVLAGAYTTVPGTICGIFQTRTQAPRYSGQVGVFYLSPLTYAVK
jgi:uncharacterized protein (TIGR03437 family)